MLQNAPRLPFQGESRSLALCGVTRSLESRLAALPRYVLVVVVVVVVSVVVFPGGKRMEERRRKRELKREREERI